MKTSLPVTVTLAALCAGAQQAPQTPAQFAP